MKRDTLLLRHARAMRRDMPEPERRLWAALRAGRLAGVKFNRQVMIGPYIADFAARQEKLDIELDGDTHAGRDIADTMRTARLASLGYRVLRFTNGEVMGNLEGVLSTIVAALAPSPQPSPRRGEGE